MPKSSASAYTARRRRFCRTGRGIDAAISYGAPSPLGKIFSKAKNLAGQNEWRFAWRPMQSWASVNPVVIQIGNIEDIAELHSRND